MSLDRLGLHSVKPFASITLTPASYTFGLHANPRFALYSAQLPHTAGKLGEILRIVDRIQIMDYIKYMKRKSNIRLCILYLCVVIICSNCANTQKYEFICQNTVSIFLLNNGKNYYFNIPVQYIGDYQIEKFEFVNGYVLIGGYKILLERDGISIKVFVNKNSEDIQTFTDYLNNGNSVESIADYFKSDTYYGLFDLIYLEESGKVSISKMNEPMIQEQEYNTNQYNIFIERTLNNDEVKNIVNEYKKGNASSEFHLWYKISINNEEIGISGLLDNFELEIK